MLDQATESSVLRQPSKLFIDGRWVDSSGGGSIDVISPIDERVLVSVAEGSLHDMSRAVGAARTAFDDGPWPRMSPSDRAVWLRRLGEGLAERSADITRLWSSEVGILHSSAVSRMQRVPGIFDFHADLAGTFEFEEAHRLPDGQSGLLVREPVGVVGAIIPWNAPIIAISYKLAPALLAGCTVVLKPAPEAPTAAYVLAEVAEDIGLPPGVINVLTAHREVSESLVKDPRVDKIAFTGSTAAGRRIASLCGDRVARVSLELGGKSAAIILDDYDVERAARTLARSAVDISGQVCASLTRVVVPVKRHDAFVDAVARELADIRVGDPFDDAVQMGPIAMRRQFDQIHRLIDAGVAEGAELACGGERPKGLDEGLYISPAVLANVDNSSTVARTEIFGPVLSVIAARDQDDAVRIANDSIYGLNAAVFTTDRAEALSVARRIKAGTVGHNGSRNSHSMAFGGFKQSGIGREGGREGLLPYLETKSIVLMDEPEDQ